MHALTIRPAADPPLVWEDGQLSAAAAAPGVDDALTAFNDGDMAAAKSLFAGLVGDGLSAVVGAGLFWVAGHPATTKDERGLLAQAADLLESALPDNPGDWTAEEGALDHMLLQIRMADDAEYYRQALGYGKPSAAANMGRSNSLTEQWSEVHPYYWKGRILWFRNRGGLDPRRCSPSWEIAQESAQELEPLWGNVNPYVHLYATDEWENNGEPWTFIDWGKLIGEGPGWARALVRSLNTTLDLSVDVTLEHPTQAKHPATIQIHRAVVVFPDCDPRDVGA